LVERCPRLATQCYWAGTAAVALEDLHHRQSFDLDFHTRRALQDVRPILAEVRKAFPGKFSVVHAPDEFGSGFSGTLELPDSSRITVEVLSNYDDVDESDLVQASSVPSLKRVSVSRYLADKIQCIVERAEARDLVDIMSVIDRHPEMRSEALRLVSEQDALLLTERLLAWTDGSVTRDLASYNDVSPRTAMEARDMILSWVKRAGHGGAIP
jgi:hypothetical protein